MRHIIEAKELLNQHLLEADAAQAEHAPSTRAHTQHPPPPAPSAALRMRSPASPWVPRPTGAPRQHMRARQAEEKEKEEEERSFLFRGSSRVTP